MDGVTRQVEVTSGSLASLCTVYFIGVTYFNVNALCYGSYNSKKYVQGILLSRKTMVLCRQVYQLELKNNNKKMRNKK